MRWPRRPARRCLLALAFVSLAGATACDSLGGPARTLTPAQAAASPPTLAPRASIAAVSPAPSPSPIRLTTARGKPIRIGLLCDQTGPTAQIGNPYCDAIIDVVTLVNGTGGIRGRPVEVVTEDHVADPVTVLDLWGRFVRRENVSLAIVFGPVAAQTLGSADDEVPVLAFGFGPSTAVNGQTHPRTFLGSACPDCQALALLEAIGDDWQRGSPEQPARIVYIHDGTDLTLDPLGTVIDYAGTFGLEVAGSLSIDPRANDFAADLAALQNERVDYGLVNVIGRPAGLLIQANQASGLNLPLFAFPWAMSQDEFQNNAPAANGYRGLQITALAEENPAALTELKAAWQARGVPGSRWVGHVFYDRGIAAGRLAIEALRLADDPDSGPSVARGFESLRDFTAGGYLPPLSITDRDHGGTRSVKLSEIRDLRLAPLTDWYAGPPPPGYPLLTAEGW